MNSSDESLSIGRSQNPVGVTAMVLILFVATVFLCGCSMTPEDKAFYGRGWINPDELDQETAPPRSFTDPTAIPPHPLEPGTF
jgi:hypothetical protein